jgi:hypothetical protein
MAKVVSGYPYTRLISAFDAVPQYASGPIQADETKIEGLSSTRC